MTELEKLQKEVKDKDAQIKKLSEGNADLEKKLADAVPAAGKDEEIAALKKQIADLQAKLEALQAANTKASEDAAKAAEAQKLAEKKSEFQKLLSEGKAVAAQEKAFLAGDMTEFVKLSEPTNMRGSGSSNGKADPAGDDRDKKVLKLAEEKRKADKSLSVPDSISLANKEIEK